MRTLTVLVGFLAVSLGGCARTAPSGSKPKNVFGSDRRVDVPSPRFPLSALVRLDSGCTGVLVGTNLVLTAAHCVEDNAGTVKPTGFVIRRDFQSGVAATTLSADRVWVSTYNPEDNRDHDWAVLHLTQPQPASIGWVKVDGKALQTLPYQVALAGFNEDRSHGGVVSLDDACAIRTRTGVRLLEDCDSTAGISGAPLFGSYAASPAVVALAVSEYRHGADDSVHRDQYSDDYANVAIDAANFADTVAQLKATVEQGKPAPDLPGIHVIEAPAGHGSSGNPSPGQPQTPGQPTPVDAGGPVPVDYPARLSDFNWSVIVGSFATVPGYGFNSFDLGFPAPLGANPLSVSFSAGCGKISDVRLRALTQSESNVWETGARFGGIGAHFSSGSMRFVRVSYQSAGAVGQCGVALYGARATAGTPPPAGGQRVPAGLWYCQAAPFSNTSINFYYWYNQSVDFARYQALSACTAAYGAVCSVACQPPPG